MPSQHEASHNRSDDVSWFETPSLTERALMEASSRLSLFGGWKHGPKQPLQGPIPRKLPPPPRTNTTTTSRHFRRPPHSSDPLDDISECTIDTTIVDHSRLRRHLPPTTPSPEDSLHRLIAELKLEVANLKSDSDQTNFRMQQLERKSRSKDDVIELLTQENNELVLQAKAMEKKFLLMSMVQTVGVCSYSHQTSRDTVGDTATSASSQNNNPYQTQFSSADEVDDEEKESLSIEFDQELMKSKRFTNNQNNSTAHDDNDSFKLGISTEHMMQDVSVHELQTSRVDQKSVQTKGTEATSNHVEVYPDDDPFSTLNEHDKPAPWFRLFSPK